MNKYGLGLLPSEVLAEVARNHKALRKQLGLTQAELAKRSGVSLGSLKRFEQTGEIAFYSLLKLADTLRRLEEFSSLLEPGTDMRRVKRLFEEAERDIQNRTE